MQLRNNVGRTGRRRVTVEESMSDSENLALDREKARRAAKDPKRPGEKCGAPSATYAPVVNRNKCEGRADCVAVCPYHVFTVERITDGDFAQLSFIGRLKSRAHG